MAKMVTTGAMLKCSMGLAPGTLNVIRPIITATSMALATTMDNIPFSNIAPFEMCNSQANPATAAATAAAMGTPTPGPCTPTIPAPWTPGATKVKVAQMPALLDNCKLMCAYGGSIEITMAGQVKVDGK